MKFVSKNSRKESLDTVREGKQGEPQVFDELIGTEFITMENPPLEAQKWIESFFLDEILEEAGDEIQTFCFGRFCFLSTSDEPSVNKLI